MTQLDLLFDRLLILLNNDKLAFKRLVKGAMDRYPGQSATWYIERVIWEVGEQRIAETRERRQAPYIHTVEPTYKLVRFFNGDQKAAERLAQAIRVKHPDKSDQWVLDKVKWDLLRDRGL